MSTDGCACVYDCWLQANLTVWVYILVDRSDLSQTMDSDLQLQVTEVRFDLCLTSLGTECQNLMNLLCTKILEKANECDYATVHSKSTLTIRKRIRIQLRIRMSVHVCFVGHAGRVERGGEEWKAGRKCATSGVFLQPAAHPLVPDRPWQQGGSWREGPPHAFDTL